MAEEKVALYRRAGVAIAYQMIFIVILLAACQERPSLRIDSYPMEKTIIGITSPLVRYAEENGKFPRSLRSEDFKAFVSPKGLGAAILNAEETGECELVYYAGSQTYDASKKILLLKITYMGKTYLGSTLSGIGSVEMK